MPHRVNSNECHVYLYWQLGRREEAGIVVNIAGWRQMNACTKNATAGLEKAAGQSNRNQQRKYNTHLVAWSVFNSSKCWLGHYYSGDAEFEVRENFGLKIWKTQANVRIYASIFSKHSLGDSRTVLAKTPNKILAPQHQSGSTLSLLHIYLASKAKRHTMLPTLLSYDCQDEVW